MVFITVKITIFKKDPKISYYVIITLVPKVPLDLNDRTVAAGDTNVAEINVAINIMTIHDLTFYYHFRKSDKNQRVFHLYTTFL